MNKLERLLAENTIDGGFLQSQYWAEFKKESGAEVFEFGDGEDFRALAIEHKLPLVGKYWFIPRGPAMFSRSETKAGRPVFKLQIGEILNKAEENKVGWVRIEPQRKGDLEVIKNILNDNNSKVKGSLANAPSFAKASEGRQEDRNKYKIIKVRKDHQPAQTVMVDLTGSEEEILMSMKHKTRYNIRLSERKGVEIFESREKEGIEKFCDLLDETAERDKITNHPRKHYFNLLEKIDEKVTKLYLAKYKNKILSGAMVSFYGEVATYLHGASSNEDRNVMSPFGLHWKIIQKAKERGMKKYDLGGTKLVKKEGKWMPEEGNWQGITRFKQGFCPNQDPVEFSGCWDIILNPRRYALYKFLQSLKDLK